MSMTESEFAIVECWLREAMEYGEERHNEPYEKAIQALSEIQQYRAIGTVSEFRELKEKATAKFPRYVYLDEPLCPYCQMILDGGEEYCECGQKLLWD